MDKRKSVFAKYIPDFQYYLVPICGYTNEELLKNADEISVVMLINKLQTSADVKEFRELPAKQLEMILRDTPPHLLNIIVSILMACLLKMNVPVEEAEDLVGKVKEKKMAELFANMEHMDIQAERRNTAEQRQRAEWAEERAEQAEKRAEQAELRELQRIRNLMKNVSCTAESAMDMLGISAEEQELYLAKL